MNEKLGDVKIEPFDLTGIGAKEDLVELTFKGELLVRQGFTQGSLDRRRWLGTDDTVTTQLSELLSQRRSWVACEGLST